MELATHFWYPSLRALLVLSRLKILKNIAGFWLSALGALCGREFSGGGDRVALTLVLLGEVSWGGVKLVILGCSFNFDSLSNFFLAKNNFKSSGFTTLFFTLVCCLGILGFGLVSWVGFWSVSLTGF